MAFTRNGTMVDIGEPEKLGSFRVEPGPPLKLAKATNELLSNDATAPHYQAPRKATQEEIDSPDILTDPDGRRLFFDAKGKPIELGKDMHYLDWVPFQNEGAQVYYLYRFDDPTAAEAKTRESEDPFYREIGVYETEEAAISVALAG